MGLPAVYAALLRNGLCRPLSRLLQPHEATAVATGIRGPPVPPAASVQSPRPCDDRGALLPGRLRRWEAARPALRAPHPWGSPTPGGAGSPWGASAARSAKTPGEGKGAAAWAEARLSSCSANLLRGCLSEPRTRALSLLSRGSDEVGLRLAPVRKVSGPARKCSGPGRTGSEWAAGPRRQGAAWSPRAQPPCQGARGPAGRRGGRRASPHLIVINHKQRRLGITKALLSTIYDYSFNPNICVTEFQSCKHIPQCACPV